MLYLADLKYMKLYKKQFYLPIDMKDKKHGSCIMLLTPSFDSSMELMNYRFSSNKTKNFISYYIERDIMYTVQNESRELTTEYGDNGFVNEGVLFTEYTGMKFFDSISPDTESINEAYIQTGNKLFFNNEIYDEEFLSEAGGGVNARYRRLLYNDRIRNNKTAFGIYDNMRAKSPWVSKTFINLARYKSLNLFVDLYYYNSVYLRNNTLNIIKSVPMYFEFIRRSIMDRRIPKAGYNMRTVFIPVDGWSVKSDTDVFDYKQNINPLSVIFQKIRFTPEDLKVFSGVEFIFMGKNGYFKMDPTNVDKGIDRTKFMTFVRRLQNNEPVIDEDEPDNSPAGIATAILDKIEQNNGVKIHSLTGNKVDMKKAIKAAKASNTAPNTKPAEINNDSTSKATSTSATTSDASSNAKSEKEIAEDKKKAEQEYRDELVNALINKVNDAAEDAADEEEAIEKMEEDDQLKQILMDLQDVADEGPNISATRAARITQNQNELMKKKMNGITVAEMVNNSNRPKELPEKTLPIRSINEEWKHLKAVNFEKEYDLNADIVKILNSFATNKTYPISVLDISMEDTSTSEDSIYTYTVHCEDYSGKRFTLRFDIPKFRDGRFMRLRGNEKIFSIEMPSLPISKTGPDEAQLSSLYKKIFVNTYYTGSGKSNPYSAKLAKAIDKNTSKHVTVYIGDNSRICLKYDLPIDYCDLASQYSRIVYYSPSQKESVTIYFNQDEIRKVPGVSTKNGIPVAMSASGKVVYYTGKEGGTISEFIATLLCEDKEFADLYNKQTTPSKYTYSIARVMAKRIPVIVILAYGIGLTKALEFANIEYSVTEKKTKDPGWESVRLSDSYINYKDTYSSMMLMGGLRDCPMEQFSIKDINKKTTWLEVLETFGARLKSNGLDNFKDLMYDPITIEVSKDYGLPTDYHEALIYASNMLADNKFTKHKDLASNRYRTNEVVAAQFYRAISTAYEEYSLNRRNGRNLPMSMKQSAIIDLILAQNTTSDLSIFQPLNEIETKNMISTKGVSGMNADRAYNNIERRGYDESMINIIAQSTSFTSQVGVNRQTTINPQIVGGRGYFKQTGTEEMNVTNTLGMTEALSPFMLTSDDPFRNDMTFTQTSKHGTPTEYSMPSLVTTGADAAMPYLVSNMFAHKARKKGKVTEITNEYMMVEYDDGDKEYVNLDEQTMKNSDGGFYITLQLKTDLKVGSVVKEDTVLAYDKKSFSNRVGSTRSQLSYNLGLLTKVAILTTEDGYEDSGVCSEWLSKAMSSDIVVMKPINLPPETNVLSICKKGQQVREGDPILIFQNAFDEEDANLLLKNLNNEDGDVTEIGRNVIKSKVTGVISDIKVYRTCELDDLSESLKKIVGNAEAKINAKKRVANKASNEVHFDSTDKLAAQGKLKSTDGVLIEIYMKYHDNLSCGDKLTLNNANKSVLMDVYKDEDAPYSEYRPTEAIDQLGSGQSVDGRIITSPIKLGGLNKVMIELQRHVCDIMGVKWKTIHEIVDNDTSRI